MLQLPKDWNITINGLAECMSNGTSSIKTILNSLEQKGYLEKKLKRLNGRITGIDYILYPCPKNEIENFIYNTKINENTEETITYLNKSIPKETQILIEEIKKLNKENILLVIAYCKGLYANQKD